MIVAVLQTGFDVSPLIAGGIIAFGVLLIIFWFLIRPLLL